MNWVIDLDTILEATDLNPDLCDWDDIKKAMKEAIHQTLVLASENAKVVVTNPEEHHFAEDYRDYMSVDKQSILDVEKLIK